MFGRYIKSLYHKVVVKRQLIIVLVLCVTIFFTRHTIRLSPSIEITPKPSTINVSCYEDYSNDILPSGDSDFWPSVDSIFFHETSCKGGLDARQACSVEAAARAHPHWEIRVLFVAPVQTYQGPMKTLQKFNNTRFSRIHLKEYARGTPLEAFMLSDKLNQSKWRVSHTSDVLRYATLYKWGGVYLDLDAVVVRPLSNLTRNWSARESNSSVAAGAMALARDDLGRTVAGDAIREIINNFRGNLWGHNGPGIITRILQKLCSTKKIAEMSPKRCKGFQVYGPELFYPIKWQNAKDYFKTGVLDYNQPYVHHVWNKLTFNKSLKNDSRYANLAKKYCPSVFQNHRADFGH